MHCDIFGQELKPGDYVAYAALWGRSSTLKVGRITDLKVRKIDHWNGSKSWIEEVPTICVISLDRNFHNRWEVQGQGKKITLSFLDRMIKIDPEKIPSDILKLIGVNFLGA